MKKINFKSLLPHLVAVGVFLLVTVIYCKPALEGKVLNQHDTQGWKGMAQQSFEYKEKNGVYPLWTNSMFSGMPAYQIAFDAKTSIGMGITVITKAMALGLPVPLNFFFLACLCFYVLCLVAGANKWVSILGGIAYAYATFDTIITAVGHNTQMASTAYAPMLIAGLLLLFQRRYLIGFTVTTFFASLLIGQNHVQVVYYTLLMVLILTAAFFIKAIREKAIVHAAKASALALIAGLIGFATCAVFMLPTYEYAKESMRGGISQLTLNKDQSNKTKGGLDKDYAFNYSVGKMETFTFIVPGLYGGSNGGQEYNTSSKFVGALTEVGVPEENALSMANGYSYWGNQPLTSGPVYLGAIICFLFIFGMFYIDSWHKWWLLAISILGILLAWGSNFKEFNFFLFDHLPFYNKFRAPSFSLVMPQLCFPLLGVLAVSKLVDKESDWNFAWKKLKLAAITTGAILLLLGAFYMNADFSGKTDAQLKDSFKESMFRQLPPSQKPSEEMIRQADERTRTLMTALRDDRKGLMGSDLLRSFLLIAIAAVLVGAFIKRKINPLVLTIGLIVLTSYDLLGVDKRYLSYDNFRESEELEASFTPSAADLEILKDPDHANFRVWNQAGDFTQESVTSYHHNSIGGYHPAKLGLYQDIIEHQISKGNINVLNMLNTKYVIGHDQQGKPIAQLNPEAYGNCWLVKGILFVNGPNEAMQALDSTNLRDTAIVEIANKGLIKQQPVYDSAAYIKPSLRDNDKLTYDFSAATPQFAVLSEVYYSAGWNAFIDGQKVDYVKVNYILRGLYVPAGKHTIEFRFEPTSFTIGRALTIWSSALIYLLLIACIVFYLRKNRNIQD